MKPWPRGAEGSSRSAGAASDRGVGSSGCAERSGLVVWGKSVRSRSRAFLIGGKYGGSPTFLNSADGDLRVALSVIRADSCSGVVLGNVTTRERTSGHANAVHS